MVKRVGFAIDLDASGLQRGLDSSSSRLMRIDRQVEDMPNLSEKLGVDGDVQEGLESATSAIGIMVEKLSKVSSEFSGIARKIMDVQKSLSSSGKRESDSGRSGGSRGEDRRDGQYEQRAKNAANAGTQFALGKPGAGLSQAVGGIPLIGPAASFALSAYSQGAQTMMQKQVARRDTMATMGSISSREMGQYMSGSQGIGFSHAETASNLGSFALSSGGTQGFRRQQLIRRGYNVDTNNLVQQNRMYGSGGADSVQNALVSAIENGKFSRALSRELASSAAGLIQQVGATGAQVGANRVLGVISNLGQSMGGSYSKSPGRSADLAGRISGSISSSLTSGGDAQKAQMLFALSRQNPNMSYAELLRESEKGIGGGGFKAIVNQGMSQYSGVKDPKQKAEYMQMYLQAQMPSLSHTEAYKLSKSAVAGKLDLSDTSSMSQDDLDETLVKRSKQAMSGSGLVQRNLNLSEQRARIAQSVDPTVAQFQQQQLRALQGVEKIAGTINAVFSNPSQLGEKIAAGAKGFFDKMTYNSGHQSMASQLNNVKYTVVPGQKRKGQ